MGNLARSTVYIETSVISYAAARPSRDLVAMARQQITREWFETAAHDHELYVSQLVIREASAGAEEAARQRLMLLEGVPLLSVTDEVGDLAQRLVDQRAVPRTAVADALHIAVAAIHGIDFLLTWNYKHIANATMRTLIEDTCRGAGFEPPVICNPEELNASYAE